MKSVNPMMVVAVLLWVVCGAAWAGGSIEFSGGGGGFSGGTVSNAVVLTGDNASGTGTLRIRPSDEDTQIVLCEASNNSTPEMCSNIQHVNISTTQAFSALMTNGYYDSASAVQRRNTASGVAGINTSAGTTAANTFVQLFVNGTGGASAGSVLLQGSGLATSNLIVGSVGTVTTDIRGPILNSGSATCNGILAGNLCVNDDTLFYSANGVISTQATAATAATGITFYSSSSANTGAVFFGNASVSDADIASKVVVRGVGFPVGVHRTDAVAAGTTVFEVMDNTSATGAVLFTVDGDGNTFLNAAATRTKGTITLAAGTGTATVSSGCTPTCSDTTAVNAVQCSVSGTTLTANGTGTDVISYHCF